MTVGWAISLFLILVMTTVVAVAFWRLRRAVEARGLDQWVPAYVLAKELAPQVVLDREPVDVFIAVCDHFEPEWGNPTLEVASSRVQRWCRDYPRMFGEFRDVDGRNPRHSFFFPQDQYRPEYIDPLAELCHDGFGEVDIHLHHHNDTPEGLEEKLSIFRDVLFHRHGVLRRDPVTGEIVYGFIHGNWALCNSRRDGQCCGVDHQARKNVV